MADIINLQGYFDIKSRYDRIERLLDAIIEDESKFEECENLEECYQVLEAL